MWTCIVSSEGIDGMLLEGTTSDALEQSLFCVMGEATKIILSSLPLNSDRGRILECGEIYSLTLWLIWSDEQALYQLHA